MPALRQNQRADGDGQHQHFRKPGSRPPSPRNETVNYECVAAAMSSLWLLRTTRLRGCARPTFTDVRFLPKSPPRRAISSVSSTQRRWDRLSTLGLALFVAGGASNWIDRVTRGRVVDFLNVGVGPVRTGAFNVADVAIMLGAGVIVIAAFGKKPASSPPARADDTA
jgi:hypothetical protein